MGKLPSHVASRQQIRAQGDIRYKAAQSIGRQLIARWAEDTLRLRAFGLDKPSARNRGTALAALLKQAA